MTTRRIIQSIAGITKIFSRLSMTLACITFLTIVATAIWFVSKIKGDNIHLTNDHDAIDVTPTMVDKMRSIGQWEFLAINDEELIDTVRTGFFSDDELVRIYYGTLHLGINFKDCSQDWIKKDKDTIRVTIPEITLLDNNFIDEAKSKSFFESGSWSNSDRKAMYERARAAMIKRCMTKENTDIARENAKDEIARTLSPIAAPYIIKVE